MPDTEIVKEALQRLYDPSALAACRLSAELAVPSRSRPGDGLHAALLGAIARLKPPDGAPRQSPAWRRYRYLQLRYVECASHEAAASDLALSLRQASRVHQQALATLGAALLPAPRAPASAPVASPDLIAEFKQLGALQPEGPVDLGEVASGVLETVTRVAADHGSSIELGLPPDLPPVLANRVALRQMLLNLLLHVLDRGGQGRIRLVASARANGVDVVLVDDRTGGSGKTCGRKSESLTAARVIAEHQRAEVESRPDGTVLLRLPSGRLRRVLVLDDNPDVGVLFQRMLARSWYHPVPVRTVPSALRLVAGSPPDAIVLDVVMPGQDGWEVLSALQADPRTASIPVVVCSVLPDRELALSLGAADFIAKPITRSVLLDVLGGLLAPKP